MDKTSEVSEDEVLRRLLKTPPKPRKPKEKGQANGDQKARDRRSK